MVTPDRLTDHAGVTTLLGYVPEGDQALSTEGNPRFQFRVSAGTAQVLNTMAEQGVTASDVVTAMAAAWVEYQDAEGGNGDAQKFLGALKNFGLHAPTASIDVSSIRKEVRESTLMEAAAQTIKEVDDALVVGITAAMIVLDNEDEGGIIEPQVIEALMYRWFRQYGQQIRRILARSERMRDALCSSTGRVAGESAQGAHYLERLVKGDFPAVLA